MKTTTNLLLAAVLFAAGAKAQIITTVAGGRVAGPLGDGGPAVEATIASEAVAVDNAGNLYIADTYQNRVRRVSLLDGRITTVAGNGNAAFGGDNGPATEASLWLPGGLSADGRGNLYISDNANNRVRRVNLTTGVITTIAGDGQGAFRGDGGPATQASLHAPTGLALENGELYIVDGLNARVRRVNLTTGVIVTVAGGGQGGLLAGSGPLRDLQLLGPTGIALDGAGNLYVAERYGPRVVRVALAAGTFTTIAGGLEGMEEGEGVSAAKARLNEPMAVAVGNGELYILENRPGRVRRIVLATGLISTVVATGEAGFAGDGGPAAFAQMDNPKDMVLSASGDMFLADTGNWRIRRVSLGGGKPCVVN